MISHNSSVKYEHAAVVFCFLGFFFSIGFGRCGSLHYEQLKQTATQHKNYRNPKEKEKPNNYEGKNEIHDQHHTIKENINTYLKTQNLTKNNAELKGKKKKTNRLSNATRHFYLVLL
jgi:hypothetical protein